MCEFYVQKIDEKFVFNDCFEGNLTRQKHFLNCKFQFITTKVEYKKSDEFIDRSTKTQFRFA